MDGLSRVLGVGTGVRLGGRTRWCRPLTLARLSSCEQYLLAGRTSPEDAVRIMASSGADQALVADVQRMAIAKIREDKSVRVVSPDELRGWLYEDVGVAFSAWLCLPRFRPARCVESALEYFAGNRDDQRAFVRVRDMVSGIDLLAAFDWPGPAVYPDDHPRRGQPVDQPTLAFMPWRKTAAKLAEARNWGPREIGRLTLYSLKVFSMSPDDPALGGRGQISARDAAPLASMTPAERKRHILNRAPVAGE